jgi:CRISPR-associated protein Csh2
MELLFIYETKDCNPNGDPLDENRPRMDPDTGVALVTDVRIKRTIRDYLYYAKGHEILVRDTFDAEGYLQEGKGRALDFKDLAGVNQDDNIQEAVKKLQEAILSACIDARLFGSTLPVDHGKKSSSIKVTGPVQFSGFSRSLHRVAPQLVQGTAAFAGATKATQKSFREDYILPYACIATYGVINEIAARTSKLTEEDVDELLEAIWYGTASLISRSKVGHQPLFLMRLRYNDRRQIGNLPGRLRLLSEVDDEKIRNASEYRIDAAALVEAMTKHAKFVQSVDIFQSPDLQFSVNGTEGTFQEVAPKDLPLRDLW